MKTIADYEVATREIITWTKAAFENLGFKNAVVCIDGEKNSAVTTKILLEALGRDHVFGVITPIGKETDQSNAYTVVRTLQVKNFRIADLNLASEAMLHTAMVSLEQTSFNSFTSANTNIETRNLILSMISDEIDNSIVVCTKNLSDITIGYFHFPTDISLIAPLAGMTNGEVKELGIALGLQKETIYKTPYDALSNQQLEMKLGFKLEQIDAFVRGDLESLSEGVRKAIDERVNKKAIYKSAYKMNFYHPVLT